MAAAPTAPTQAPTAAPTPAQTAAAAAADRGGDVARAYDRASAFNVLFTVLFPHGGPHYLSHGTPTSQATSLASDMYHSGRFADDWVEWRNSQYVLRLGTWMSGPGGVGRVDRIDGRAFTGVLYGPDYRPVLYCTGAIPVHDGTEGTSAQPGFQRSTYAGGFVPYSAWYEPTLAFDPGREPRAAGPWAVFLAAPPYKPSFSQPVRYWPRVPDTQYFGTPRGPYSPPES
jgi:hypothetical protein